MLINQARVETERFSRYLVQLCRHYSDAEQVHVEWPDDRGVASFGWGRCTLRAEAPEEENLQRVHHLVADHLERFDRRDHLTVTWPPPSYPDSNGDTEFYLAGVAAETTLSSDNLRRLRDPSPVLHAGVGLLLLLVAARVTSSPQKSRVASDEKGGDADLPKTSPSDAHRC